MSEALDATLAKVRSHLDEGNFELALDVLNSLEGEAQVAIHYYHCVIEYKLGRDAEKMLKHSDDGIRMDAEVNAFYHYRLEALVRLERWQEASDNAMYILNREPENYSICFKLADIWEKLGRPEYARIQMARGHHLTGRIYYQHQQYEKALKELDQALQANDSHKKSILLKVSCLMALDRIEETKAIISKHAEIEEIQVDLLTVACDIALKEHDFRHAKHICDKLMNIAPDYEYPRRVLFNLAKNAGQSMYALSLLEEMDKENSDDIWAQLARYAYCYELSNDTNFINSQDNPQMFWSVVRVLYDSGAEDYAYRKIKEYKNIDNAFADQLQKFCEMLFENGKRSELDELLTHFPIEEWNRYELMLLYGKNLCYVKSYHAEFDYFDKFIEKAGEQDKVMYQYARDKILYQLHYNVAPLSDADIKRFSPIVKKSIERFPEHAHTNYMYAGMLAFTKRWEEAEEYFKKARHLGLPSVPSVYGGFWVAAMQYSQGKFDEALEFFVEVFETRYHSSWNVKEHLTLKEKILAKSTESLW